MNQAELNLIQTLRESDNENALLIATEIILSVLAQLESSQQPCFDAQPALA